MPSANSDMSDGTVKKPLIDPYGNTVLDPLADQPRSEYEVSRKKVYYFLERPESRIATTYHLLNLILIVGSIIMSILSTITEYENDPVIRNVIFYYEIGLLSWFSIEYLFRIWSCSFLSKYKGTRGKLRFMKTFYMLVDAFVIVSTLTTAILHVKTAYFTILRITRFLQVFRILRLDRQRGDLRTMGRVVYQHRKELITCYFVGFIILFGGTYIIYICEKKSDKSESGTIDNMANGLYWAMITVTSVGYGDYSPNTWPGKMLSGVFALVGCAFFALPAGILGSGFALQVAKQKKQERYVKVRNPAAITIQNCWRNYAVRTEKYRLQATWTNFFPHVLARQVHPLYYDMLPGIKDLSNYDINKECSKQVVSPKPSTDDLVLQVRNRKLTFKRPSLFSKDSLGKQSPDSPDTVPNIVKLSLSPLNPMLLETLSCQGDGNTFQENNCNPTNNISSMHRKISVDHRERSSSTRDRKMSFSSILHFDRKRSVESKLVASQMLNRKFKAAIRFILRVKYWTAVKSFKNIRYPFVNVQDIMEKSAQSHAETLTYLKDIKIQFSSFQQELQEMRRTLEMLKADGNEPDDEAQQDNVFRPSTEIADRSMLERLVLHRRLSQEFATPITMPSAPTSPEIEMICSSRDPASECTSTTSHSQLLSPTSTIGRDEIETMYTRDTSIESNV